MVRLRRAQATPESVSTLELFFDLVFVFTLTQLTGLIEHELSWLAVLRVLLLFGVLWWMYGAFAWVTNAAAPSDPVRRVLLVAAMAGFLVMALALPQITGSGGIAFGLGYLVVVLVHLALFGLTEAWRGMLRVAPFNLLSGALVLTAGFLPGAVRPWLWAVALAVQVVTPRLARVVGEDSQFRIAPGHFVERHGLLLIVAFGESVVSIGKGVAGRPVDPRLAGTAVLVLALLAMLWWVYFGAGAVEAAEARMRRAELAERPRLAVHGFFYSYIPMMLGIVLLSAGVAIGLGHGEPSWPVAAVTAVGVAGYLAGDVCFRRVLSAGPVAVRTGLAVAALGTAPVGRYVGVVAQLAVLAVLVAAGLAVEAAVTGPRTAADGDEAPPANA
ncbi:membrane protein [Actinocatenispora thailandica]|uniref:Membrane protein n=1 Tax=Actinocatenispora thailandica TaxID=227318 RepID=A0A7R7HYU8_9ACTN|nr:low temperature requirement protein A [Actinocatenispora thailandica]BCJ36649.1 membrane protein [Actinocatenispora thailandica]